jgi:hypothetical protein
MGLDGPLGPSLPIPSGATRCYTEPVRVALVHDWLIGMRGGECGREVFCVFPDADLYTLL